MKSPILIALRLSLFLTLLTGLVYPLSITGLSSVLFPEEASGSVLRDTQGLARGSALVGQKFDRPEFFWGRLSQTAESPYNATAAGGGNLGSSNPELANLARARIEALEGSPKVPLDLVTSSGSGLDPHISPSAASFQIERVSRATGLSKQELQEAVDQCTEGATWGILGQPRVNVVKLNFEVATLMRGSL